MLEQSLAGIESRSRRIQFAVRQLQGLTPGLAKAPLGLFLLFLGALFAWLSRVDATDGRIAGLLYALFLGSLSVALTAQQRIKRRYGRRLGHVLAAAGDSAAGSTLRELLPIALISLSLGAFIAEGRLKATIHLPAFLALPILGSVFGWYWLESHGTRAHCGLLAVLMAFAGLVVGRSPFVAEERLAALFLAAGAGMVVCGVCDHLLLARALPPTPEEP